MDREHLETITGVLAPLTRMLREAPFGASVDDIALIETEFGLSRLPGMVHAFLTIVGRDELLVRVMFAGESPFDVATLLGDARHALVFAAELGAPERLLRGGLPYTGTGVDQSWLRSSEQALEEDHDDPQIWAIVEGGGLDRGTRFAEDIARRVEWGMSGVGDLRERVDRGFPDPIAEHAVGILGEERYADLKRDADELMRSQVPADMIERLARAKQEVRRRDIEMRERLVD